MKILNQDMAQDENVKAFQEIYGKSDFSFQPFFAGRLMMKIQDLKNQTENSLEQALNYVFGRISLAGLAVIVFFLANIFINQETFSLDALMGISDVSTDDLSLLELEM